MKKTLTINLNNTVFNIDEDAYELLDKYLCNLLLYFKKDESSSEIMSDFEARIAELFHERLRLGHTVINIEQVREIIAKIGNPEDFGEEDFSGEEENQRNEITTEKKKGKRRLYRNIDDKMFGGICSGIGNYFGWETTPVRIIFFILVFVTSLWIIPLYLIAWLLIPAAKTIEQKLEMRGEEVNVENIGKATAEPPVTKERGVGTSFVDFIVSVLKILGIGVGCMVGVPLILAFILVLFILVCILFGSHNYMPFIDSLGFDTTAFTLSNSNSVISIICLCILLGIPLVSIIYSIVAYFFKLKPIPTNIKWVNFIVWIIAFVVLLFAGLKFNITNFAKNPASWNIQVGNGNPNDQIVGNGELTERSIVLAPFETIKITNNLVANVRLVEAKGDSAQILINGDSNLIDKIGWNLEGGDLKLFVNGDYNLRPNNSIIIKLITPNIKKIKMQSVGSVTLENKITGDDFTIDMDGAGEITADSIEVKYLSVNVNGLGSVNLKGNSRKTDFTLKGAGQINALELDADTVSATLNGIGSIKSNPIDMLDASVNGIGKISYKNEPKNKNVRFKGIGEIGPE